MSYAKLVICALSAVVLLSPSSSKSELQDRTQIQFMSDTQAPAGSAVLQLRHPKKMSPTHRQPALCTGVNGKCTQDSDCCSGACDTFANGCNCCI
jgi:hypothetical protein